MGGGSYAVQEAAEDNLGRIYCAVYLSLRWELNENR